MNFNWEDAFQASIVSGTIMIAGLLLVIVIVLVGMLALNVGEWAFYGILLSTWFFLGRGVYREIQKEK